MSFPQRVLIANRGEIASRIVRTCRELGVESVAIYHSVDADLAYVKDADVAVQLEGDPPVAAYLDQDAIVAIAVAHHATAVHPGYGFLSENTTFAAKVEAAGMKWIGPSAHAIEVMGDKIAARNAVAAMGVPVGGGSGSELSTVDEAVTQANTMGYPVMLKASAGGGGIGMVVAHDEAQLRKAFDSTQSMAARSFGSDSVFLERYVVSARHIEVQVLGQADGTILAIGERDCSVQRRHQKIVEECPPPGLQPSTRERLHAAAIAAATSVNYLNAGTVEFLLDTSTDEFVFLEMNTRIQVEHPVTEMTFGVDLIAQQLSIAATGMTTADFDPHASGHSFEFRIYAEDPVKFFPSPGPIETWQAPTGNNIRVDTGFGAGNTVTQFFDPMIAKLCVHGANRAEAIENARAALEDFQITGLKTNLPFLRELVDYDEFVLGAYDTQVVPRLQKHIKDRIPTGA